MERQPPRTNFEGSLGANPLFLRVASAHMSLMTVRIDEVIDRAVDRLIEAANTSESDATRNLSMDCVSALTRCRDRLRDEFLGAVGRPLRDFCRDGPARTQADSQQAEAVRWDEVRILDDSDIVETLAVESAVQRAELRFQGELYMLSLRLGALAGVENLSIEANPLAPERLADCLRQALGTVTLELPGRLEMLHAFDRLVLRHLDGLYQEINDLLASAGVLPHIRWRPAGIVAEEPRVRDQQEPAADEVEALEGADGEAAAGGDDAVQSVRRAYLDGWLFGSIQSMLGRRRQQAGSGRPTGKPIASMQLAEAISRMQAELSAGRAPSELSIEQIKEQALRHARSQGADPAASLADADETMLDAMGMLFDFITQDSQLPTPFQSALGKLTLPYLRAGIQNPGLLSDPESPAKLLLNELAEAGMGWTREADAGGKILSMVNSVVEQIVKDQRGDSSLFARLHQDFKTFQERHRKRADVAARREKEAMAGRERLRVARRSVGHLLAETVADRQLPDLVENLLRKSWAHVMVLTLLKHGEESDEWQNAVRIARELVWSVTFEPRPDEVRRLRTTAPVLAKALARGLRDVGYSDSEIRKVVFQLKQLYGQLLKSSGTGKFIIETSMEGVVIRGEDLVEAAANDEDDSIEDIEDDAQLSEMLDSVRRWKPGQWVVVATDRDDGGEPLRAKLSWISPITNRLLFVNQRGVKAMEKSPVELAEDLMDGRISTLDTEEIVSRAMGDVARRLQDTAEAA